MFNSNLDVTTPLLLDAFPLANDVSPLHSPFLVAGYIDSLASTQTLTSEMMAPATNYKD